MNPAPSEAGQFVTLGLGREVFAVKVELVQEILDMRDIAKVPNLPAFVLGMIDVRGRAVSVIDLRRKLGLAPAAADEHTRIVVLESDHGRAPMGLVADRVYEVTTLADQAVEAPPEVGVRWDSDYIRGIGRHNDSFVIILDIDRLLPHGDDARFARD